jgi:hypothetical protein
MLLWLEWFHCVSFLRQACSRHATFIWMTLALAGLSIRADHNGGVSSIISVLGLHGRFFNHLRRFFHASALDLTRLLDLWGRFAMSHFGRVLVDGRPVFIGDGIKIPKEGKKMPAVKSLHQESSDNSKPAYIMGHSFQCLCLLAQGVLDQYLAVPLVSRIHEGVVFSNRGKKTLLDRFAAMFLEVATIAGEPSILLADAYYASRKVILPLLTAGHALIAKIKINTVAFLPAPPPVVKKRGRPRLYGDRVKLRSLFRDTSQFTPVQSPVYGERAVLILYRSVDLLWRPIGCLVRFVLIRHPLRGDMILMCTDMTIEPLMVLWLYSLRFKIEVSFKQALWTIGAYCYRFWMMAMKPTRRCGGNQYLHRASESYRLAVRRKLAAYHRYVALGCIAQGLLQYLGCSLRARVWSSFGGWLRTMNPDMVPSEQVTAQALRSSLPDFLCTIDDSHDLKKFISQKADPHRVPGLALAA